MKQTMIRDIAQIALVAALYVALTLTWPLSVISFGSIQFRVSEMLNFLAFYNPKYIIAVTIGCMIANFYSFTMIDVLVGGGSTLVFLSLGVLLFRKYMKESLFKGLINKAFFYFAVFFSLSMVTIALEMYYIQGTPFFFTWLTMGLGEFLSLFAGAIVIEKIAKRVDFSQ